MSSTELYAVRDGVVEGYAEFRNASRGAMILWMWLSKRYLPEGRMPFLDLQPLWDLAQDPRLRECERVLFASTMDGAVIRRERLPEFISAIRVWESLAEDPGHWPQQADALRAIYDDPAYTGVCWNQTSVNSNPWVHYGECPTCEQTLEESEPYDVSKGDRHHFVFGYAEEQAAEA